MEKSLGLTQMQKLVENAEQIAGAVKDSQLKQAAFERILSYLLPYKQVDIKDKESNKRVNKSSRSVASGKTKMNEGPKAWMEELVTEDFFKTPKNINEVLIELGERGHHLKASDLTLPLQTLTKGKQLRRKKQASIEGGKLIWHYSNW